MKNGVGRRPSAASDDERGNSVPLLPSKVGFSGQKPHQQKEHIKSYKMIAQSSL